MEKRKNIDMEVTIRVAGLSVHSASGAVEREE